MRQTLMVVLLLGCVLAAAMPVVAADGGGGGAATVIAAPAIYLPAGGKVVTEVNLSDDDVLGIIKQALPAVGEVVKEIVGQENVGGKAGMVAGLAGMVDTKELSEAIEGIKNIRLLVVRYPRLVTPEKFIEQFSAGVAKAGPFNKIVSDFGMFPGALALYALPNNAGCMGFAYIPAQRTAYAVRVVGGVDVPKLIKWGGGIAKMVLTARAKVAQPEGAPQPNTSEEPPPAAVQEK